jgi:hypothetical protein
MSHCAINPSHQRSLSRPTPQLPANGEPFAGSALPAPVTAPIEEGPRGQPPSEATASSGLAEVRADLNDAPACEGDRRTNQTAYVNYTTALFAGLVTAAQTARAGAPQPKRFTQESRRCSNRTRSRGWCWFVRRPRGKGAARSPYGSRLLRATSGSKTTRVGDSSCAPMLARSRVLS